MHTPPRREHAQILLLAALLMVVLLIIAGSAYDYASLVSEREQLQNAVDSSTLAGANALANAAMLPSGTSVVVAEATAREYLRRDGFATQTPGTTVQFAFPTSTPVGAAPPSSVRENITLDVTKNHPTYFWQLIGLNNIPLPAGGGATAARGMVDVMLSLDTTGSMELSGTDDFQNLIDAVSAFITQLNPTSTDPRGPQIGIARFAGIKCSWARGYVDRFGRQRGGGDGDTTIDSTEYVTPCSNDENVLTNLTKNKSDLLKIAENSGGGACPISTTLACPIKHIDYTNVPVVSGTPTTASNPPVYTGTKLPNGVEVVSNGGYYAWSTANGGRNDVPAGTGVAKKVLVFMTDGFNEANPTTGPEDPNTYDAQFRSKANTLKLGPDGIANTADDVEIYSIGFFCTPYSSSTTAIPGRWCKSLMLGGSQPYACPGSSLPNGASISSIDQLLIDVSSSTPGTCDHYFPLKKTDQLPDVFRAIAGRISRGRLTS